MVVAERSASQVERESGVVRCVARRDLEVSEMRTRDMLGYWALRVESWDRKCRPTPPAPGEVLDFVEGGFAVLEETRVGIVENEAEQSTHCRHFSIREAANFIY